MTIIIGFPVLGSSLRSPDFCGRQVIGVLKVGTTVGTVVIGGRTSAFTAESTMASAISAPGSAGGDGGGAGFFVIPRVGGGKTGAVTKILFIVRGIRMGAWTGAVF